TFSLQATFPRSRLALVTIQPSAETMVPRAASLSSHSTRTVLSLGRATTFLNAAKTAALFRLGVSLWAATGPTWPRSRTTAARPAQQREGRTRRVMDHRLQGCSFGSQLARGTPPCRKEEGLLRRRTLTEFEGDLHGLVVT